MTTRKIISWCVVLTTAGTACSIAVALVAAAASVVSGSTYTIDSPEFARVALNVISTDKLDNLNDKTSDIMRVSIAAKAKGPGVSDYLCVIMEQDPNGTRLSNAYRKVSVGWPLHVMHRNDAFRITQGSVVRPAWWSSMTRQRYFSDRSYALWNMAGLYHRPDFPNAVRYGPLLISSLIYGCALGVVGFGCWYARIAYRQAKGYCQKCGYSLDGTNIALCPECGRPILNRETSALQNSNNEGS